MLNRPNTTINLNLEEFELQRKQSGLTIFCGSNNSGKSFLLKNLHEKTGYTSYFLAVQRFYNAHQFTNSQFDPNKQQSLFQNFIGNFRSSDANNEQNILDLNRLITDMSNTKRKTLFEICETLLNQSFRLVDIDPNNKFSASFIEINGINMSYTSAGTRLLVTLIATLLDDSYDTYFLDEPELGLTPRIQTSVSEFLYDNGNRKLYFPHVKNLYISTHSHIFLDRKDINNNFVISNDSGTITVNQIKDISSFHTLQFNLLGNTFESLFLPSLIIIVEGNTDFIYIKSVLDIKFPKNKLTVISAGSDTAIIQELIRLENVLLDISTSPYKNRIFVVVDKVHSSATLIGDIEKRKISKENIIEWDSNGIEYQYPISILCDIFSCDEKALKKVKVVDGDKFEINGICKTKTELADLVASKLTNVTIYPNEFSSKLIDKISKTLN